MKKFIATFILFSICCTSFSQQITQIEYFVDTDKGVGKKTQKVSVPANADSSYVFTVNLSAISVGYHKLYFRTKSRQ